MVTNKTINEILYNLQHTYDNEFIICPNIREANMYKQFFEPSYKVEPIPSQNSLQITLVIYRKEN